MTDSFILSRILDSKTFQVGPYRVPKYLLPKSIAPILDLEESRNTQRIRNLENPNNIGFEIFLVKHQSELPEVIRELPIIASPGAKKNFYILDYFFPTLGLAVELDSKEYHVKEQDRLRDNDLKSLGIDVLRVYGFSVPALRKDKEEEILGILKNRTDKKTPLYIDYSWTILRDFRIIHKKALDILESKPLGGIDYNLYILDTEELEICQRCLRELEILKDEERDDEYSTHL